MKYLSLITAILISTFSLAQNLEQHGIDASKGAPEGLEAGTMAPSFSGVDVNSGEKLNLQDLLQEGPVVVIFYRGSWCPVCNRHLSELEQSLQQVRDKGATVVAIAPETEQEARKMSDNTHFSAHVITDADGNIMKAYGVQFNVTDRYEEKIRTNLDTDIASHNQQEDAQLPIPATYIIDTDGKIKWRHFDPDYHERASAREILDQL